MTTILLIIGGGILAAMTAYTLWLFAKLKKQKEALLQARIARVNRLKESIDVIAHAMEQGECNHSEGVIRLKMLLEPLGKPLNQYVAMWELYGVVQNMPTHDDRKALTKQERMRLDLARESAEAKLEEQIKLEVRQLLTDIAAI